MTDTIGKKRIKQTLVNFMLAALGAILIGGSYVLFITYQILTQTALTVATITPMLTIQYSTSYNTTITTAQSYLNVGKQEFALASVMLIFGVTFLLVMFYRITKPKLD